MIYYIDESFEPSTKNPFNQYKPYDQSWILLKVVDDPNFKMMNGGGNNGVFTLTISKKCDEWKERVMDFISYEQSHHKNVIVSIHETDLLACELAYRNHHYMEKSLRAYEPKVLVHSTTIESYQSILKDGCLKSWDILKSEGKVKEDKPIGSILGDPIIYSDYVMFTGGGVTGEIVVNSKQNNQILMDIDTLYQPGVRFYFDAEKIAKDGLLTRDGAHLKVKDELPLEAYLIWSATKENVGLNEEELTPRNFAMKADQLFTKQFNLELE